MQYPTVLRRFWWSTFVHHHRSHDTPDTSSDADLRLCNARAELHMQRHTAEPVTATLPGCHSGCRLAPHLRYQHCEERLNLSGSAHILWRVWRGRFDVYSIRGVDRSILYYNNVQANAICEQDLSSREKAHRGLRPRLSLLVAHRSRWLRFDAVPTLGT
ncbi:hypothetical protein BV20DRAFT_461591 [Pilatotrama ljubarskyi]|nr:hypothetical protein BV20DRAFT_461591 [Pilatotrama ljubarskyi]